MSDTVPEAPEEDGVLAGEYVLGVLERAHHFAAADRAQADPAFAAEVAGWEARLSSLIADAPAVTPPARLWAVIAARIGGTVVPLRPRASTWDSVALWRGMTAAAVAVAAASLVVAILPRQVPPPPVPPVVEPPAPAPLAVARLDAPKGGPEGGALFVASYDEARRELIITPTAGKVPTGHDTELWLIPPDKAAPISLGVFRGQQSVKVPLGKAVTSTSTLAVSVEAAGGSTTGLPMGPVIAAGMLSKL